MPFELPSPRLGGVRLSHHRQVIEPFAVLVDPLRHLGNRFVQSHDAAGLLESFGAEGRRQQREGAFTLVLCHLFESNAGALGSVHVVPPPPLHIVCGERGGLALLGCQHFEERVRRVNHRLRRHAG